MGIDAQEIHVGGQHVAVLDGVGGRAGRDVDRLRFELHRQRLVARRRRGQEQADRRLNRLRRAARQQMHLDDEVGALRQRPGALGRLHERRLAGRPAVHVPHFLVGHRGEPGLGVGAIQLAREPRPVDAHARMVHDGRVLGAEFDRLHVAGPPGRNRDDEVAEHVLAGGRQRVRRGHLQHEIRLAELPALRPRRHRRTIGRVTLGRSLLGPPFEQGDLCVGERAWAGEVADLVGRALGQPRRHDAVLRGACDFARVRARVAVVEEAERGSRETDRIGGVGARIHRPVAGAAVRVEDRRDVLVERRRSRAHASPAAPAAGVWRLPACRATADQPPAQQPASRDATSSDRHQGGPRAARAPAPQPDTARAPQDRVPGSRDRRSRRASGSSCIPRARRRR